jgi:hypothetical protein
MSPFQIPSLPTYGRTYLDDGTKVEVTDYLESHSKLPTWFKLHRQDWSDRRGFWRAQLHVNVESLDGDPSFHLPGLGMLATLAEHYHLHEI